ncbi:MAG TPA: ATP-binding protein [Solirubrobacteraceae bacterium]
MSVTLDVVFVNRSMELEALAEWWEGSPRAGAVALVWGRRRVGKTALLSAFAKDRRTVFHTGAGRPARDELGILSRAAADVLAAGVRDLGGRPFVDWDDALESIAIAAVDEPLLLVLDEFPELLRISPELPGVLRAFWDRTRERTRLRILLCGSAVRTMHAIQEERAPLYGRIDLTLALHPFAPHETALMLRKLAPSDRALIWGILGGVPLYLTWWDQGRSVRENLARLVCRPGGRLLDEGRLVLATEGDTGELGQLVLRAIAAGATKHGEIEQAVRAEPARTLERLIELRLVERIVPVTEAGSRTRRRSYRIADNFLAFWLGIVEPYKAEIERGLGPSILSPMIERLDDHMGARWEEAFRSHLRRLAAEETLAPEIVRIGAFWSERPAAEIDAVALAGRREQAVLLGEAKWARTANGARLVRELERKASALPLLAPNPTYAICARERITNLPATASAFTAADIFA